MFTDTYRYDSTVVAFYIAAWANEHKVSINVTKIQKLLYVAYGANLIIANDRLCAEHPQAWPYGPVFPKTRTALLRRDISKISFDSPELKDVRHDDYLKDLAGFVFGGFGNYNAGQLTTWSHQSNSPWDRTVHMADFKWGREIPDQYIFDFFNHHISVRPRNGN